jgi:hypothetical protein
MASGGIDAFKIRELQSVEKVGFNIPNSVLHTPFGVGRELHPIRMNQNSSSPLFIRSIRGGGDVSS